jgi:hypothetical protein
MCTCVHRLLDRTLVVRKSCITHKYKTHVHYTILKREDGACCVAMSFIVYMVHILNVCVVHICIWIDMMVFDLEEKNLQHS